MTETRLSNDDLEKIIQGVIAGLRGTIPDDRGPDSGPWNVEQAAKRLGVCGKTVRKLEESGKLNGDWIGLGRGTLRFWPKDLDAYRELARGTPALKSTDAKRKRLLKL